MTRHVSSEAAQFHIGLLVVDVASRVFRSCGRPEEGADYNRTPQLDRSSLRTLRHLLQVILARRVWLKAISHLLSFLEGETFNYV